MFLFCHPTGNANVRQAALALHEAGLLGEFWTSINYEPPAWLERWLPGGFKAQMKRRSFPPELSEHIRAFPAKELVRLFAPRAGLRRLVRHETGPFSVDAIYSSLDQRAARRLNVSDFTGVYAYEDGAAHLFRRATELGLRRCYDLPIGYWRAAREIMSEEAERQPAWAATIPGNRDSAAKTANKDFELSQANVVFVASSFTLKTLEHAPAYDASVVMIPYGSPRPPRAAPVVAPGLDRRSAGAPLRVLFVGSLGQRKGLSYLFDACDALGRSVELTLIGTRPGAECKVLDSHLSRHRWIPSCPHQRVLEEMSQHDVLVFPSLFEGFGLVLLEAMAMGLPIVTTAHTAGPDLIEDGKEGFIVPIRDSAAIADKLSWLAADPDRRREMGARARVRAAEFTWSAYRQTLSACLASAALPV